jgi:hypothetical protein
MILSTKETIRIGAGAGFSGDRIEPAVELAQGGDLDFLVFECLAERTIALAQLRRIQDPSAGFDPLLRERMQAVLPECRRRGVKIVTNMGATNPLSAAQTIVAVARDLNLHGLKVAAVIGDDVLDLVRRRNPQLGDRVGDVRSLGDIVSANAYLGAEPIVQALANGADVVITGRVCDPALFLAPMIHHFGWALDDWMLMGRGTILGHLLECAGQLTGGYFADPGLKDVKSLARLGFPLAEVRADGTAVLSKVPGSGGRLDLATCKEQLLYEILDPAAYVQADVVADLRTVRFEQLGPDRVLVSGGAGTPRPTELKVSVGYHDGYIGEGHISYAGRSASGRARLAGEIVRERLAITNVPIRELRTDLIGVDSLGSSRVSEQPIPHEVRLRIATRTSDRSSAARVGAEVESLYTNGPFGGGGAWSNVREVIAIASTLIDRSDVHPSVSYSVV